MFSDKLLRTRCFICVLWTQCGECGIKLRKKIFITWQISGEDNCAEVDMGRLVAQWPPRTTRQLTKSRVHTVVDVEPTSQSKYPDGPRGLALFSSKLPH